MASANMNNDMIEEGYGRHFLIAGRRVGVSEDTVAYICVSEDEDPESVFIREILYGGQLPDDWEDRFPTYEENSFGDWAHINGNIELPFGVFGSGLQQLAVELTDFRLSDGEFSAEAISMPSGSYP
jgi:hypothetical protein